MDADFWLDLWARNHVPFHGAEANPLLVAHLGALALPPGARIFVPLCGKTRDIGWLLAQGFRVAGVEISPIAVTQLFDDLGVTPDITKTGPLQHVRAPDIDIHVGDIFALTARDLGAINAVYDRAAVIALPPDLRPRYADHIARITDRAPQIVITYERVPTDDRGPPFSIDQAALQGYYGRDHALTLLDRVEVHRGPDGGPSGFDAVWLLR